MDLEQVKLGICLPITKQTPISYDFFLSWTLLDKLGNYQLILPKLEVDGSAEAISSMRNDLVKEAIETDCTHIIMMDTDQTYPQDTIIKLLQHQLPIVYGMVFRRYVPFDPILLRVDQEFNDIQRLIKVPEEEWKNNNLVKVDATGCGCMLAETSIFFDLKYPWFRMVRENPRLNRRRMGEDIFFCLKRLKPAGYEVWVDTKIGIGHEAKINVNEGFYDLIQEAKILFR